jgi:hypothetical protein
MPVPEGPLIVAGVFNTGYVRRAGPCPLGTHLNQKPFTKVRRHAERSTKSQGGLRRPPLQIELPHKTQQ